MTFRIAFTLILILETLSCFFLIGLDRAPVTGGMFLLTLIANAILIYGLWHWT